MRRAIRAGLCSLTAAFALPRAVAAQGENAVALARGTLRITLAPDWARHNRRFGENTPGFASDTLEPIGVDFSSESLGVATLAFLQPVQTLVRDVTGLPSFALNLGRSVLTLNANVRVMPLALELALSRRLSLAVTVPLVRSRVEAFLLGPDTAGGSAATRGNVGWNPRYLDGTALAAFLEEVDSALIALATQATSGPPPLRPIAQRTFEALRPLLCGLYTLAGGSARDDASPCSAAAPVPLSPFLPLIGSEAGDTISTRVARARNDYQQVRGLYATQGDTLPTFNAEFSLPTRALDSLDLRRFFSDSAGPLAGDSLTSLVRTRLGDIEVAATLQLADRRRYRGQVAVTVRLPTGFVDSPDSFIDLGTGDRQLDLELALRNDVVLGGRFWVHAGGRFGVQFPDDLVRRVTPANFPLAPAAQRAVVRRDLGDYVAVSVVPTWQLDDAFSVGIGYHFFRQGASRFSFVNPADEARVGLPARVLDQETAVQRMRIGAGVTFSTLGRYAAGRASLPYTVSASYQNTFRGEGGAVPQASSFTLAIRGYLRLWR